MNADLLQDNDGHVEMMMLHGGGGVNSSQGGANVYHEFVIEAPMIQIMAESSNEHGQALQHAEFARTVFEDAVDAEIGRAHV